MLRDPAARRRLEVLNPITTSLGVNHPTHLQTPQSGISSTSLSAPFGGVGYAPQYTPVSAVRPYNPQSWMPSPPHGSDGPQFAAQRHSEMEGKTISYGERLLPYGYQCWVLTFF